MDEASKAAAWVEQQLSQVRALVDVQPLGPRDQTLEQFEAQLRGLAAACLRDVQPYVGLTAEQAATRAASTGDFLCVHHGPTGHRANWRSDRVHVEMSPDGRVLAARLDEPLPWDRDRPGG